MEIYYTMLDSVTLASSSRAREREAKQTDMRILCYGDSLTAGYTTLSPYTGEYAPWAPQLSKVLGVPVDHVGMSGWTTG